MNKFLLLTLSSLFILGCSPIETPKVPKQVFEVSFDHRGNKTNKPLVDKLIYLPNSNALNSNAEQRESSPIPTKSGNSYYMDVESVFCGEDICKVDFVRIFWDELGFYQRFELKPKVKLEKGDGEDFTQQDYQKLHKNLLNRQNGLGNLYKSELVKTDGGGNAVDALSGATVALNKQDYVEGAIWTCYTLWHFANGELPQIIRNITAKNFTTKALVALLFQPEKREQYFAIEQLTRRKIKSEKDIAQVLMQYSATDKTLAQLIIHYVETLPAPQYFSAILKLLNNNNSDLRLYALTSLTSSNHKADTVFYQTLTQQVTAWTSYQNISLYFEHLTSTEIKNTLVIRPLTALLKHQNFSVARDAYWFLDEYENQQEQESSTDNTQTANNVKQRLIQFYQQHQNQL